MTNSGNIDKGKGAKLLNKYIYIKNVDKCFFFVFFSPSLTWDVLQTHCNFFLKIYLFINCIMFHESCVHSCMTTCSVLTTNVLSNWHIFQNILKEKNQARKLIFVCTSGSPRRIHTQTVVTIGLSLTELLSPECLWML